MLSNMVKSISMREAGPRKVVLRQRKKAKHEPYFKESSPGVMSHTKPNPLTQPRYSSSTNPSSTIQTYNPPNNQSNNPCNQRGPRPERFQADLILVSDTELFPKLIREQLVSRVPIDPILPPYPRWYDPNASCDYHYRAKGHSMRTAQL